MKVAAGHVEPVGGPFTIAHEIEGVGKYASAPLRRYAHVCLRLAPSHPWFPPFDWQVPREELSGDDVADACRRAVQLFLSQPLPNCGYLVRVRVIVTGGCAYDTCNDAGAVKLATAYALLDAVRQAPLVRV